MKKLILLVPLLALAQACSRAEAMPNVASALMTVGRRPVVWSFQCASLTENSPATDPQVGNTRTDGISSSVVPGAIRINGESGYRITLLANSGSTLSGAGTVDMYYCPTTNQPAGYTSSLCSGIWPKNPGLSETVTVTATSCRSSGAGAPCPAQTFPDREAFGFPDGWIRPTCNGVTESSGTTPTILVEFTSQT